MGASSQKLADRPPPRSSTPRKPRRLELYALLFRPVLLDLADTPFGSSPLFDTPLIEASTIPNSVTDDCAEATPAAARAARATRPAVARRAKKKAPSLATRGQIHQLRGWRRQPVRT